MGKVLGLDILNDDFKLKTVEFLIWKVDDFVCWVSYFVNYVFSIFSDSIALWLYHYQLFLYLFHTLFHFLYFWI